MLFYRQKNMVYPKKRRVKNELPFFHTPFYSSAEPPHKVYSLRITSRKKSHTLAVEERFKDSPGV